MVTSNKQLRYIPSAVWSRDHRRCILALRCYYAAIMS